MSLLVVLFIIFIAGIWMIAQQNPQEVIRRKRNESHYLSNRAYYLAGKNMGKSFVVGTRKRKLRRHP